MIIMECFVQVLELLNLCNISVVVHVLFLSHLKEQATVNFDLTYMYINCHWL